MKKTQENLDPEKSVVNKPIYLSITSIKVPNLTLIDLPGFTKVAVKGQSDEICKDIDDLVDEYIKNPNTIILAVSPANANIATSDALMLAKKYDPKKSRTFGVTLFYLASQIKILLKLKKIDLSRQRYFMLKKWSFESTKNVTFTFLYLSFILHLIDSSLKKQKLFFQNKIFVV